MLNGIPYASIAPNVLEVAVLLPIFYACSRMATGELRARRLRKLLGTKVSDFGRVCSGAELEVASYQVHSHPAKTSSRLEIARTRDESRRPKSVKNFSGRVRSSQRTSRPLPNRPM